MNSKSYQDTIVWQKAHSFVLDIYNITRDFPSEEKFGITSQLRRAAVSVPNNFVEGFGRIGYNDKRRFYNISKSSLDECHYLILLSKDLGLITCSEKLHEQANEINKLLHAYIQSVPN